MLVRGWAMCGIAGIVIRSAAGNVTLISVICVLVAGAHLTATRVGPSEHAEPSQVRSGTRRRSSTPASAPLDRQASRHLLFRSSLPVLCIVTHAGQFSGHRYPVQRTPILSLCGSGR